MRAELKKNLKLYLGALYKHFMDIILRPVGTFEPQEKEHGMERFCLHDGNPDKERNAVDYYSQKATECEEKSVGESYKVLASVLDLLITQGKSWVRIGTRAGHVIDGGFLIGDRDHICLGLVDTPGIGHCVVPISAIEFITV